MFSSLVLTRFLLLFFLLVCLFKAKGQTDTEFWFAAPEVSTASAIFDKPIYFRISTTQQASNVTISQPANASFTPIVVQIAANTTRTIDLSDYIDIIENKPANSVLNYGLLITASNPVSAYYEVASTNCNCNPELFSLKGRNALGTLFYTPFQNIWDNSRLVSYTPTPYSSFDIVATENNTTVTITPKNDLIGHPAGMSFSIVLNKGQTYAATASSQLAGKHLGGSKVSADKPIAVTVKDDLLYYPVQADNVLGIDLVGDQIVPVNIIGNEYIVHKGLLYNDEKVFIMATQPATAIYLNGTAIPESTINAGESYILTLSAQATYIKSDKPVYVLHISGFEYELGAALLPKIDCNGSRQVGFTRSNQQVFGLNLVVKKGGEGTFVLNGKTNIISASNFSAVPGTGGEWMAAQIKFNTTDIPVNQANLLINTKSIFQMGLIDGNDGGASYGYFSDFATLNLGFDKDLCTGRVVTLDAGIGKDSYLWNDGSNSQTLTVTQAGKYWVKATVGNCVLTDTITVTGNSAEINLGTDLVLCEGQNKILQVNIPGATYKWQDGSANPTFEVRSAGTYWVEVTTTCGTVRDEITISYTAVPKVDLGQDYILCAGQQLVLDAAFPNATYIWQDGSTKADFVVEKSGLYYVEVKLGECTVKDSVFVNYTNYPIIDLGKDTTLCNGQVAILSAYSPLATYKWQDGSTKSTFEVEREGSYWVEVTNACATVRDEISIQYRPSPDVNLGADTSLCVGRELILKALVPDASYRWQDGSTSATYTVTEAGIYWVEVKANDCSKTDSIEVKHVECPEDFKIPNVFTPNGDEINETFFVRGILLGKWQLEIYNRWGKIVYQSEAYHNDWKGENVTNGVYYYLLKDPSIRKYYKGWVHIIR